MSESKASVARAAMSGKTKTRKKTATRYPKSRAVLAIFARAPQRGKVKTRLAAMLGDEAALQLYIAMLRDTLAFSRRAMSRENGETVLFFTPPDACDFSFSAREYSHQNRSSLASPQTRRALSYAANVAGKSARDGVRSTSDAPHKTARRATTKVETRNEKMSCEYSLRELWSGATFPQSDGDLGKKMRDCCDELRARGAQRVVIIGADIPDLPPEIIAAAFDALEKCDLVFGPAHDGGFYLLGASRKFSRALFSGVRWSCANVLSRVLVNARRDKLRIFLLPMWRDVDDVSDLRALKNRLRKRH